MVSCQTDLCRKLCPPGFYELFKVLKRAGDGEGIKCLMTEAKADRVKLKDSLSEEVEAWLRKQGF